MSSSKQKRTVDDGESDALVANMSTIDKTPVIPKWLEVFCKHKASFPMLQKTFSLSIINSTTNNVLTALANAFGASGLQLMFETEMQKPDGDIAALFDIVFNDDTLPHTSNKYMPPSTGKDATDDGTADDEEIERRDAAVTELDGGIKFCFNYLYKVASALDLDGLFLFLGVFEKLRLQPFTSPFADTIHIVLDAMPEHERLAALEMEPTEQFDDGTGWSTLPGHEQAVRQEIKWTAKTKKNRRATTLDETSEFSRRIQQESEKQEKRQEEFEQVEAFHREQFEKMYSAKFETKAASTSTTSSSGASSDFVSTKFHDSNTAISKLAASTTSHILNMFDDDNNNDDDDDDNIKIDARFIVSSKPNVAATGPRPYVIRDRPSGMDDDEDFDDKIQQDDTASTTSTTAVTSPSFTNDQPQYDF